MSHALQSPSTEVAPGMHRLTGGVSNFYLVEQSGGLTLVDAGTPGDWRLFLRTLDGLGCRLDDLDAVVLTHAHPDHVGFAERARREGPASVWVLLAQDVRIAMPPRPTWYSGREQVIAFVRGYLLTECTRWRLVPTSANGQPAAAAYLWVEQAGAFMPDCLVVLTLRGGEIEEIMAFRTPEIFPSFDLPASIAA